MTSDVSDRLHGTAWEQNPATRHLFVFESAQFKMEPLRPGTEGHVVSLAVDRVNTLNAFFDRHRSRVQLPSENPEDADLCMAWDRSHDPGQYPLNSKAFVDAES